MYCRLFSSHRVEVVCTERERERVGALYYYYTSTELLNTGPEYIGTDDTKEATSDHRVSMQAAGVATRLHLQRSRLIPKLSAISTWR